jgi:hypothetical protein
MPHFLTSKITRLSSSQILFKTVLESRSIHEMSEVLRRYDGAILFAIMGYLALLPTMRHSFE